MLSEAWPWYVSGPLIGLTVPMLLFFKNKSFGVSSSYSHICTILTRPKNLNINEYMKENSWNIYFIVGIIISGVLYTVFVGNPGSGSTELRQIFGQEITGRSYPKSFYDLNFILSAKGFFYMCVGGLFIGFGTRYANGCTSGHAITGLANRQLTSLIAVIGFFIGGLLITYGARVL